MHGDQTCVHIGGRFDGSGSHGRIAVGVVEAVDTAAGNINRTTGCVFDRADIAVVDIKRPVAANGGITCQNARVDDVDRAVGDRRGAGDDAATGDNCCPVVAVQIACHGVADRHSRGRGTVYGQVACVRAAKVQIARAVNRDAQSVERIRDGCGVAVVKDDDVAACRDRADTDEVVAVFIEGDRPGRNVLRDVDLTFAGPNRCVELRIVVVLEHVIGRRCIVEPVRRRQVPDAAVSRARGIGRIARIPDQVVLRNCRRRQKCNQNRGAQSGRAIPRCAVRPECRRLNCHDNTQKLESRCRDMSIFLPSVQMRVKRTDTIVYRLWQKHMASESRMRPTAPILTDVCNRLPRCLFRIARDKPLERCVSLDPSVT